MAPNHDGDEKLHFLKIHLSAVSSVKYVWFSDTHLNLSVLPFLKRRFIMRLRESNPDGLLLTGDISSGLQLESDLRYLAKHFDKPIYFVLGNHDLHDRHIASVYEDVRRISREHPNLHWMTEKGVIELSPKVGLIGVDGWYDAERGDPSLLKYTTDWLQTPDFYALSGHEERLEVWRGMAQRSADLVEERLQEAIDSFQTVYILTHVPPWPEATRAVGTMFEKFWLPYNTNVTLGRAIERVMEGRKKRRVIVLAGHTHEPCHIRVSGSISCMVARASYWGRVRPEETIIV